MNAKPLDQLKAELMQDPAVHDAYKAQAAEYAVARAVIAARVGAGLSQAQLAQRMGTQQSFIARLESGRGLPSMATMVKIAQATGTRLHVGFEGETAKAGTA